MAKFIKSFFSTAERRKSSRHEETAEEDRNISLSLDARRNLSISRSGRMKQANKKRHSLSLDVYNQDIQMVETQKSNDLPTNQKPAVNNETDEVRRSLNADEEIDTAFEIINKTLVTDL